MNRPIACALLGGLLAWPASAPSAQPVAAWIEVDRAEGAFAFRAVADGPAGKDFRYELEVEVSGAGGRSRTRQAGRVSFDGTSPSVLSSARVNVQPGSAWRAALTLSPPEGETEARAVLSGNAAR
jgi:hypothetical protein